MHTGALNTFDDLWDVKHLAHYLSRDRQPHLPLLSQVSDPFLGILGSEQGSFYLYSRAAVT